MPSNATPSPPWPRNVKSIVAGALLVFAGFVFWRFFDFVMLFVLAAIIAFVLHPIVDLINGRLRLPRGLAVFVAYLAFSIVVGLAVFFLGTLVADQVGGLVTQAVDSLLGILDALEQGLEYIDTVMVQFNRLYFQVSVEQLQGVVDQFYSSTLGQLSVWLGESGAQLTGLAQGLFFGITRGIVTLVISIYLVLDAPRFFQFLVRTADEVGYGDDAGLLLNEFQGIWHSYFRGQVVLALTMAALSSLMFFLVRVDNPLALGLLAGMLELIPVLGQYIMMAVTIVLVLFQSEPGFGMSGWLYALLVASLLFGIQQIQGNVILPRVHGRRLNLHPVLILLGVLMGASLAGVLGAIMAPPMLATIKLFGYYTWRKLLDLPPFSGESVSLKDEATAPYTVPDSTVTESEQ